MIFKEAYSISLNDFIILFVGFIGSAIIAFLTIKIFLQFVQRIGMIPFVLYRFILGSILLLL
jgi:undecaprenyl-diphosphatase